MTLAHRSIECFDDLRSEVFRVCVHACIMPMGQLRCNLLLVKVRPHLKAAVEALETIGRERPLTNVEFVRRREFMLLVSGLRRGDYK